jgi:8-oxo-dGTP pyrophosphatase MutT (NUDIX family)
VREYRHGRHAVLTGLAGGAVDPADAGSSLDAAARRELREERGCGSGRFLPVLTAYPDPSNQTNTVTVFLAPGVVPVGAQTPDGDGEATEAIVDVLGRLRRDAVRMHAIHVATLWSVTAYLLASGDEAVSRGTLQADLRRLFASALPVARPGPA